MTLDALIGRTVIDIQRSDYGDEWTLVLDDGNHVRFTTGEYDDAEIYPQVLDRVARMGEVIDRRVREFEQKQARARAAERAEEQRIVRERMERLLRPAAYREWLRLHQPSYVMNRTLKRIWANESIQRSMYSTGALVLGEYAVIPINAEES